MNSYSYIAVGVILLLWSPKPLLSMMKPCRSNSQCGGNECCAFRLKMFGFKGYCFKTKSLGEMCSPSVKSGKHFTCGCNVGLTCAITDIDKRKNPKYRCVQIPTEAPEIVERQGQSVEDSPQNSPYAVMFGKYLESRFDRLRSETERAS